jgi:hypothetical protein
MLLWDFEYWSWDVYLTNNSYDSAEQLQDEYNHRSQIEPLIAEAKNDLGAEAMSSHCFEGNEAMLLLKLLVHNLLQEYAANQLQLKPRWRTNWVRHVAIRIPGKLVRSGRQLTLRVPDQPALFHALN